MDAALAEALVRKLVTDRGRSEARATGKLAKLDEHGGADAARAWSATRRLLREHGLPQPISNGFVCGYEVDLHWPEHRS